MPSLRARRQRVYARRLGLGNPIERCLASTRRGNRWWVGRALQMAGDLADHLGLRDGGENPQRPLTAKRTFLKIQQELLLRTMDIIETSGTRFALPSQMSYSGTYSASGGRIESTVG